jgi:hypothetical protein
MELVWSLSSSETSRFPIGFYFFGCIHRKYVLAVILNHLSCAPFCGNYVGLVIVIYRCLKGMSQSRHEVWDPVMRFLRVSVSK